MRPERAALDVAHLPSVTFGSRSLLWWGTLGFMLIEGFSLLLLAVAYFYLRRHSPDWPPAPHPAPDVLLSSINVVLLLLLIVPMKVVHDAARRFDRGRVTAGLLITAAMTVPVLILRWMELDALNISHDTNAYGSIVWAIVVLHGTLIAVDLMETAMLGMLFFVGHAQKKHFADAGEAALYQNFLSLVWLPLYLIIYWSPRFL